MTRANPLNQSRGAGRLRVRAYAGEADLPALVTVQNAENEADGIPERTSVGELAAEFGHASALFDAKRDVSVAELGGEVVGHARREWVDVHDAPLREYRLGGAVHPAYRRRGIGRALLRANEEHLRLIAGNHDTAREKVFGAYAGEQQAGAVALLEKSGYARVRWFFDMLRPTLDDVPELPLPDGLEVRPITPDLYRQVWDADLEAFRDHWGGHDDSDAAMRRLLDAPDTDPRLWLVAFEGSEIAGGVLNTIYREENEALGIRRGWLDSVFTRRQWRRRGLARALIARSLLLLREQGMVEAMLGVDADNPTGALGLYESVGFELRGRYSAWRKPLTQELSR